MSEDQKVLPGRCGLCGGVATTRSKLLYVRDGAQRVVSFTDCPSCDRARCTNCREYIADKWAVKCPCGNPTK